MSRVLPLLGADFAALVLLLTMTAAVAARETQDWVKADLATTRLPPSAFPELPDPIRQDLTRRGCTIPQPFTGTHQNVIRGRFTSARQTDWAVLCSIKRRSSILVFRNGSTTAVAVLAAEPDSDSLQVIGAGTIGYSRALGVADADFIRVHHGLYGGPKPPPLDHDGIDDLFIEKGSVVRYWFRGRWLELTGAN